MNAASVTAFPRRVPPTILVVEDDVLTRCSVSDELRAHGFKVLEASTAHDALTVLETVRVDLLFVDIHLPGQGNGVDVVRFAQEGRRPTQVILTSADEAAAVLVDVEGLGLFVRKPYRNSHVIELVSRSLNWPEAPQA